jgi:hypothetical protein
MQFIRRAVPAGAAITSIALLAAGCGGSSPNTTSTAGGQPAGNLVTQAYRFAACMRNHGVSDFPEPRVSTSNGSTKIALVARPGPVASPQFKAAQTACRSILPEPSKADLAGEARQRQIHKQDLLGFAHCLREHGITGFPDPNAQGELSLGMVQAAGIDLTAPNVRTAALACVPASNGAITRAEVMEATSGNPPAAGTQSSASSGP